jgi:hypothetical protein
LATVEAEQAVSSGTLAVVPQAKATQVASLRVPEHVDALLHTDALRKEAGQSVAVEQQVPPEQQKPLLQIPLWQAAAPVMAQLPPSPRSGTQSPPLQWASTSQLELVLQLPPQTGATWDAWPLQKRLG